MLQPPVVAETVVPVDKVAPEVSIGFGFALHNAATLFSFHFDDARLLRPLSPQNTSTTVPTSAPSGRPTGKTSGSPSGSPFGSPSGSPLGSPLGSPTAAPAPIEVSSGTASTDSGSSAHLPVFSRSAVVDCCGRRVLSGRRWEPVRHYPVPRRHGIRVRVGVQCGRAVVETRGVPPPQNVGPLLLQCRRGIPHRMDGDREMCQWRAVCNRQGRSGTSREFVRRGLDGLPPQRQRKPRENGGPHHGSLRGPHHGGACHGGAFQGSAGEGETTFLWLSLSLGPGLTSPHSLRELIPSHWTTNFFRTSLPLR